ncbi:MAG TPA: SEC-C domain-containing protein, partial [Acidimicrobiia bacterium]|nr:SEC-C domain-containing protein [Acidimicrobiia bacterium]
MDDFIGEAGPLAWLSGDRTVHVGDLTDGCVFTHRLTDAERTSGQLDVGFDLAGFARHGQLALPEGEPLEVMIDDGGRLGWRGPAGWLERFEADTVVAVRVSGTGVVTLEPVVTELDPDDLPARLRAVYDAEVAEPWLPVPAEDLVLGLQLEDRSTFAQPRPPLCELVVAAGLERRGEVVAHDDTVWHSQIRTGRLSRVLDMTENDTATARTVLRVLDVADVVAGVDPAAIPDLDGPIDAAGLRAALGDLTDGEVLSAVATELFDGPESDVEMRAERFVAELVAAARVPREVGVARFLAAVGAERNGDLDGAEGHLRAGHDTDPDFGPLVDRLAWYASDRGDAAQAARLWRRLPPSAGRDQALGVVAPFASPAGERQGRNQPCWCGSGRKYKQCHLGSTARAPLPERVGWLCRKAVTFLERCGGAAQADVYDIAAARAVDPADPDSLSETFEDPIVMDLALTEGGWFETFLAERGSLLPDDEALLARSWLLVPRTVYEVGQVRPGDGLVVRDLRSGEEIDVRERTFSRQARPGALVCA